MKTKNFPLLIFFLTVSVVFTMACQLFSLFEPYAKISYDQDWFWEVKSMDGELYWKETYYTQTSDWHKAMPYREGSIDFNSEVIADTTNYCNAVNGQFPWTSDKDGGIWYSSRVSVNSRWIKTHLCP